jgi:hypothetical protein
MLGLMDGGGLDWTGWGPSPGWDLHLVRPGLAGNGVDPSVHLSTFLWLG